MSNRGCCTVRACNGGLADLSGGECYRLIFFFVHEGSDTKR